MIGFAIFFIILGVIVLIPICVCSVLLVIMTIKLIILEVREKHDL